MVESLFAIVFLLTLMLGTMQVVFILYSRNVVRAAAQEGVRSAVERGGTSADAVVATRSTVAAAAGRLVRDLDVTVAHARSEGGDLVRVTVRGRLRPFGPLPISGSVTAVAHALAPADPR